MNQYVISFAIALCGIAGGASAAAPAISKDVYKAEQTRIEARAKVDKKACGARKANARDICAAEAKGREKVARAELEARYRPGLEADLDAKNAKADADYEVAKEKCDDARGNARDACLKRAKGDKEAAVRLGKVEKVESERAVSRAASREHKEAKAAAKS